MDHFYFKNISKLHIYKMMKMIQIIIQSIKKRLFDENYNTYTKENFKQFKILMLFARKNGYVFNFL